MKNQLKVLRAQRDWSQADLADRLDVSRQTVNAIEDGDESALLPLALAIVGAGPAGVAAAHDLSTRGYECVIYDASPSFGGMLAKSVPSCSIT